jgi:hypothetical protein
MLLAVCVLLFGLLTRFMPHEPNFTPVLALALFGGIYLKRSQALLLPLALMMVSDLFIGLHPVIGFTWGSIFLISCIGLWIRQSQSITRMVTGSLVSAMLFFVVTNFGCWIAYYPHTWEGFSSCYALAVPFFRGTLLSTLLYTVIFFGGYELLTSQIRKTRLAPVLLK